MKEATDEVKDAKREATVSRDLLHAIKAKCNVNDCDRARVVILEKQVTDLVEDNKSLQGSAQKWRQEAEMYAEEGLAKEEYIAEIQAEAGAQAEAQAEALSAKDAEIATQAEALTTKDADLEIEPWLSSPYLTEPERWVQLHDSIWLE